MVIAHFFNFFYKKSLNEYIEQQLKVANHIQKDKFLSWYNFSKKKNKKGADVYATDIMFAHI